MIGEGVERVIWGPPIQVWRVSHYRKGRPFFWERWVAYKTQVNSPDCDRNPGNGVLRTSDSYTPSRTTGGLRGVVSNATRKIPLLSSPVVICVNAGMFCKK